MQTEWVRVDADHIVSIMPLPMASNYGAWLKMNPDKSGRLELVTAGVVAEFRTALLANPANVVDQDPQKLPAAFVRYAEALCIGVICQEMDFKLSDSEQSRYIRAEINLRYFYTGRLLIAGMSGGGKPTYRRPRGVGMLLPGDHGKEMALCG